MWIEKGKHFHENEPGETNTSCISKSCLYPLMPYGSPIKMQDCTWTNFGAIMGESGGTTQTTKHM